MTGRLKDVLDHDFAGGIKKKLDDVYRVGTGVRTEKSEKESRTSFLVRLFVFCKEIARPPNPSLKGTPE